MDHANNRKPNLLTKAATFLCATALGTSLAADPVFLRSVDGTINLEGDLIGFDEEFYILQTPLGDLRVSADRVFCEGDGCPTIGEVEADVIIGGSDTLAEGLMPLLLAGFATEQGAEAQTESARGEGEQATTLIGQDGFGDKIGTFSVVSNNADDAFQNLQDGSVQVAIASRRITPDEARALSAAGAGNMVDPAQEHIVAIDSLVLVVNQSNPVNDLSVADIAGIYSGRITNWSQLGGPNLAIDVVTQQDSGTNDVFEAGIFGDDNTSRLFSTVEASDNIEAAIYVDENPGAIAYVGFAFKRGQKPLGLISECGIGTNPDAFSVKTEEYALFQRLFMYTRADSDDQLVKDFVDFSTSPAASNVILQSGFIGLDVEKVAQGADGARANRIRNSGEGSFENSVINDMIAQLAVKDRLSSTFRFRTGSTQLDPRGQVDLVRLATYLEELPNGTEVTFAGFADNVGAFEPNMVLSEGRAEQVRDALLSFAGNRLNNVSIDISGYGEVAPSACNSNDAGRSINRRVETWIKLP